jgi:hypothetical protein
MPTHRSLCIFFACGVASFVASMANPTATTLPAGTVFVTPAALQNLLPVIEGWSRGELRATEIENPDCRYTFATASYTKDDMRLKVTLADTESSSNALAALAAMVVTLPDDYNQKIRPATTIQRLQIADSPAAELWDAEKMRGEVILVLANRFVVEVQAQKADAPETMRAVLASVDLKALAALR